MYIELLNIATIAVPYRTNTWSFLCQETTRTFQVRASCRLCLFQNPTAYFMIPLGHISAKNCPLECLINSFLSCLERLPVRIENRPSTTILGDSSYFAQRYPLVNYFQEPHLKVPAILLFLEICENLKTRLKCGFLFDKLSKICCENQATVKSLNEFN